MKDSLFVFQNGTIDSNSVTEHASGTNLDFFAVPTSSLTSISALEGKIVLYFKSSNTFENSRSNQAKVTLNTTEGSESRAAIATWALTLEEGKIYIYDDTRSTYPSNYGTTISGIDSVIRPSSERFSGGSVATTVNVLSHTDAVLGTVDASVPDTVKLMSSALSFAKVGAQGRITTSSPSPSGIAYEPRYPLYTESFITGDSWDNYTSGNYDRTQPVFPANYAKIKRTATQADVRGTPATSTSASDAVVPTILESNNAFGNKFRFTDDQGNASSATVGSNLYAHVDWLNHDFATAGATADYVIDHLTGWGYTTKFATDGVAFNMDNTSNGQDWATWIAFINGTHHGYTGWIPLDLSDIKTAHGAYAQPDLTWADNFFLFESLGGTTRGTFLTGESAHSTILQVIYDTSNYDLVRQSNKTPSAGFIHRTTNIFMKRKHY